MSQPNKHTSTAPTTALTVPATYMRGGTSKAVFFHERDVPPPGELRDEFMIRVMGSPDPNEIDGMGGGKIVTSKAAIIRSSQRPDADVDYTFVQVGLGESTVSYDGNCGNVSSAVGPFAVNEGLLQGGMVVDGRRVVRIYVTGTNTILIAHVPVDSATGCAREKRDYSISGCPGTGAPILMDYSETAKPAMLLPTTHAQDRLECSFGPVDVTYCAVANPIVFVEASVLGIVGNESPAQLDADKALLARVREVRGRTAHLIGKCQDWTKVDTESPMLPMVALLSKATTVGATIRSRLFLDKHCHPIMAGTASVCTTAAAHTRGSLPYKLTSQARRPGHDFVIEHPAGQIPISVAVAENTDSAELPRFKTLGFVRTARYIMQGALFIPEDMHESWIAPMPHRIAAQ